MEGGFVVLSHHSLFIYLFIYLFTCLFVNSFTVSQLRFMGYYYSCVKKKSEKSHSDCENSFAGTLGSKFLIPPHHYHFC